MTPLDLTLERWRRLVDEARLAARLPGADALALADKAHKIAGAALPVQHAAGVCGLKTFLWACQWFGHADVPTRVMMAPGLLTISDQVVRLLTISDPGPPAAQAMAQPIPAPDQDAEPPAWLRRRDIGGD